jgi:hypothetical protein
MLQMPGSKEAEDATIFERLEEKEKCNLRRETNLEEKFQRNIEKEEKLISGFLRQILMFLRDLRIRMRKN